MSDEVKIIECPRDAWQGLTRQILTQTKANYLRKVIDAGFTHIDAVSFVSPAAVPQMADAEQVLGLLSPPATVEIIGVVVNRKGAERAVATRAVQTLGFPYSISPEFLRRNQHQTPEESLDALESIVQIARDSGLDVVAYISMAFGNPYGDLWNIEEIVAGCDLLADCGIEQVSLADTVGLATPSQISEVVAAAAAAHHELEIGVHLHARPEDVPPMIRGAFAAGCRRFDGAVGGLGGCPFAQDALVGNIPTETLLSVLADCGATLPKINNLDQLLQESAAVASLGTPIH